MWIKFEKPRRWFTELSKEMWFNSENFDKIMIDDNRHTITLLMYKQLYHLPMTTFNMKQLNKLLQSGTDKQLNDLIEVLKDDKH